LIGENPKINGKSNGQEEEAHEQAAKRLDIGFQLMAKIALREHHAGDQRAKRCGKIGLLHHEG
jgi:hypothetical protein